MPSRFHPQLINEPFGDPGLYVEFMFEKRAILFDLGDLANLSARKLLRVSDVFVSHMHMDHFCGFDRLLKVLLGRDRRLRLFGPEGLVDAVGNKLGAYTWNLVHKYKTDLTLVVAELVSSRQLRVVEFACHSAFRPEQERFLALEDNRIHKEDGLCVRTTVLDHGIPCLAFALEESARVNIWKNRLAERGLGIGPWLRDFKSAILGEHADEKVIRAEWKVDGDIKKRALTLGELRRAEVATITPGVKIAYIVDAAPTEANFELAVALVKDATMLYIEAAFLEEDNDRARERHHLTARQAGAIAKAANVERLVTLHYSPRYEGRVEQLAGEAESSFRGCDRLRG